MPAARKKGSRRGGSDPSNQLVWTLPVTEPASSTGFSFAPNMTPVTFDEPTTTSEHDMFVSVDDFSNSPRRTNHAKKKPDDHIPRPPNAFILFRSSFIKSQHVSTEVETNHSTLSKIIGLTWQNLPDDQRKVWHAKAKQALDEHKRKFPQYAFRPLHARGKGGTEKRKVREVGPKDLKRCAKIAELLVEGKKGQDLDAAIQEFDKHHVPEVVTRFDAPITEETFQKPSSSSNNTDVEGEDVVETRPRSPSIFRTPSKKRLISRSASRASMARSESPGPPPPLVDRPESYEDFLESPYPSFNINTFTSTPPNPSFSDPLMSESTILFPEFTAGAAGTGNTMTRPSLSINTSPCSLTADDSGPAWGSSLSSPVGDSNNSFSQFPEDFQSSSFDPYTALSGYSTPQLSPSHSLSTSSSYESLSSMYDAHAGTDSECITSTTLYQEFDDLHSSAFLSDPGKEHPTYYAYSDVDSTLNFDKLQAPAHFLPSTFDLDLAIYGLAGTIQSY